ncbi:MAG: hypothetical protein ACTSRU_18555, partial [Candidatus Hodarchaeales archaeon]
ILISLLFFSSFLGLFPLYGTLSDACRRDNLSSCRTGRFPVFDFYLDMSMHLVLPTVILAISMIGWFIRALSNSISINCSHETINVFNNANQVIANTGQLVSAIITEIIIIELTFNYFGIGNYFLWSFYGIDIPVFQSILFIFMMVIILSIYISEITKEYLFLEINQQTNYSP